MVCCVSQENGYLYEENRLPNRGNCFNFKNAILQPTTFPNRFKNSNFLLASSKVISSEFSRRGMEARTLDSEEIYDVGCHPSSPSADQSFTDGLSCSVSSRDLFGFRRTNSETSAFSGVTDDISSSEAASSFSWKGFKSPARAALSRLAMKQHKHGVDEEILELELELMKERFSKLLLGEDMSGSGKGVCIAVTISNAITNLYASIFGHHQRLEPLNIDKKLMWKREMNCLLSVCDYMVELSPTVQTLKDGTTLEVMMSKPRSDIYINLPALKKLDAMLLDILDSFDETEFWYAEQGSISGKSTHSGSFRKIVQPPASLHSDEKWWLPVPCMPQDGLTVKSIKHLRQKRDCANQIHKAAIAINSGILSEMQIPESYLASLPKSGKASVGEAIYKYLYNADKFSADHLLDSIKISTEHEALELVDKVEASMYTWRRKMCTSHSKSSWGVVKDLVSDIDRSDKNHLLADRADTLIFCIKQRFPELSQTTLDTCKIQYNKDVGQGVLESYSRVLESLAFNIVAWVDDVLFVDKTLKKQDD